MGKNNIFEVLEETVLKGQSLTDEYLTQSLRIIPLSH